MDLERTESHHEDSAEDSESPSCLSLLSFLHDSVALGNFEDGLLHKVVRRQPSTASASAVRTSDDFVQRQKAEVERLPLLLRVLSKSRPLSTATAFSLPIASGGGGEEERNDRDDGDNDNRSTSAGVDEVLEEAVRRLEDRAAVYSVAESVEVVACHLAPFVCRKISKLSPPFRRHRCRSQNTTVVEEAANGGGKSTNSDPVWDTTELTAVALNPSSSRFQHQQHHHKRRKGLSTNTTTTTSAKLTKADDPVVGGAPAAGDEMLSNVEDDSDIEMNDIGGGVESDHPTQQSTTGTKRKRLSTSNTERDSMLLARGEAEDSQEAFVTKTLSELSLLVAKYLQNQNNQSIRPASAENAGETRASKPRDPTASTTQTSTKGNNTEAATATAEEGAQDNNNNKNSNASNHNYSVSNKTAEVEAAPSSLSIQESSLPTSMIVSMEESILAQARVVSEISGGGVTGTDLGAACASLLFYAPVLRHSHTAAALCQAGQPQTPRLIRRLGVNCPTAIPSLVRGCLDSIITLLLLANPPGHPTTTTTATTNTTMDEANHPNDDHNHPTTTPALSAATAMRISLARASILELSELSPRERRRILTTLTALTTTTNFNSAPPPSPPVAVLLRLQLEITIRQDDPVDLACFLVRHLPSKSQTCTEPSSLESKLGDEEHASSSLSHLIAKEAELLIPRILKVLFRSLRYKVEFHTSSSPPQKWGKSCVLLRACLWLFVTQRCTIFLNTSPTGGDVGLSNLVELASGLVKCMETNNQNSNHHDDKLYCMLLSCLIFTCFSVESALTTEEASHQEKDQRKRAIDVLGTLLTEPKTFRTKAFAGCVASALLAESPEPHLRLLLLDLLGANHDSIAACQAKFLGDEEKIRIWVSKLSSSSSLPNLSTTVHAGMEKEVLNVNSLSLPFFLASSPNLFSREKIEGVVQAVASSPNHGQALKLIVEEQTVDFITTIVTHLDGLDGMKLPIIQPLQIEMQALVFLRNTALTFDSESAVFLLQLIYCFSYWNVAKQSPFAFNPRSMPLRQIWLFLCNNTSSTDQSISTRCKDFLLEHVELVASDAVQLARYQHRLRSHSRFVHSSNSTTTDKEHLKKRLRSTVSNKHKDPSGIVSEQTFIELFFALSDQDLVCSTMSALLCCDPKTPGMFMTHTKLYEDPLAMLKCSMVHYWTRPGVRRIALFILTMLLNANSSALFDRACKSETTCLELIAARDLLIARCLISSSAMTTESQYNSSGRCFATLCLLRRLICSDSGLAACLFRQGLPPEQLDWLIDNVPEITGDLQYFTDLLSERILASPTERLSMADGVVRTVILYGQRSESQSESLILGSLSQLIAAFFLVLGPSGVSVSTLMSGNDSWSADASQASKKAAMRIFKHLTGIRGYRPGIRNESVIALQKLLRLCRGEELAGGLPVALGARQKSTLRELQDAIGKALLSMGVGS